MAGPSTSRSASGRVPSAQCTCDPATSPGNVIASPRNASDPYVDRSAVQLGRLDPNCTMRPSRITATASAISSASAWSWVTTIAVVPAARSSRVTSSTHLGAQSAVERAERLVEQHHRRPGRERPGERDRAAAGRPRARAGRRCAEALEPDHGSSSSSTRARRSSRWSCAQPEADVGGDVEMGEQCALLGDEADPAVFRRRGGARPPSNTGSRSAPLGAGAGSFEPGDHPQQRGLAAARGAEHRDDARRGRRRGRRRAARRPAVIPDRSTDDAADGESGSWPSTGSPRTLSSAVGSAASSDDGHGVGRGGRVGERARRGPTAVWPACRTRSGRRNSVAGSSFMTVRNTSVAAAPMPGCGDAQGDRPPHAPRPSSPSDRADVVERRRDLRDRRLDRAECQRQEEHDVGEDQQGQLLVERLERSGCRRRRATGRPPRPGGRGRRRPWPSAVRDSRPWWRTASSATGNARRTTAIAPSAPTSSVLPRRVEQLVGVGPRAASDEPPRHSPDGHAETETRGARPGASSAASAIGRGR